MLLRSNFNLFIYFCYFVCLFYFVFNFLFLLILFRYIGEKKALVVLAGLEYGSGSSRDWAAKYAVFLFSFFFVLFSFLFFLFSFSFFFSFLFLFFLFFSNYLKLF
jgi:hypothetical protein